MLADLSEDMNMQQQGEQAWRRSTQRNFHQHLQLYSFPDVSLWMTRMSTCCGCLREKLYRHRSFQQSLRRFQVRDICGQFSVPFVGVSCPFHFRVSRGFRSSFTEDKGDGGVIDSPGVPEQAPLAFKEKSWRICMAKCA